MAVLSKFTVIGNPIAQSKSPSIHRMFAAQAGLQIEYDRTLATADNLIPTLTNFFLDPDATGCNITAPFKEVSARWVDELSDRAKLAGAINTIVRQENGTFLGDTTDGQGLVEDLQRLGVSIKGERILLLGAGGAARGVLHSILALNPKLLVVANRTEIKAKQLAMLAPQYNCLGLGLAQLGQSHSPFTLIINSTSTSLTGDLPAVSEVIISGAECIYDMSYADKPTAFIQHAQNLGVKRAFDGIGMLVGQAAESFYLWTGYRPNIEPVVAELRAGL